MQIACSFVLLAGAGMLVATLTTMQTANTGYDLRQVLAIDLPATGDKGDVFEEAVRRVGQLPGVQGVAAGMVVPWRDDDVSSGLKFEFAVEGYQPANGEDNPTARFRPVSSRFFAVLGVPILAGRDFADSDLYDHPDTTPVAIVSQSVAQRLFPNGDALNRKLWTAVERTVRRRIVGIVEDVDDEHVVREPSMAVYVPFFEKGLPSRLFVRTEGDPYALVPAVRRVIREIAAEQPVENLFTLEDVRGGVLAPERLNAFVFAAIGGTALLIAVVGIAGVLAFSVSARTREFGIRLAIGSTPSQLLTRVLKEGAVIVMAGIPAGVLFGYVLARVASAYLGTASVPGVLPTVVAAVVLIVAAVVASLIPAARASRVDVLQALRSE